MSASRSDAGASSSQSGNPDPDAKTYPKPKPTNPMDSDLTTECIRRLGIVTTIDIGVQPRMFQLKPYGDNLDDWPTQKGGDKLHVQLHPVRDEFLAVGKIYEIFFERDKNSADTVPYTRGTTLTYGA